MIFTLQNFYHKTVNILFFAFVFIIQSPIYLITLPLMIMSIKLLKNNSLNNTLLFFTFMTSGFLFISFFFTIEVIFNLKYALGRVMTSISGIYLLVITNLFNKYISNNKKEYLKLNI